MHSQILNISLADIILWFLLSIGAF